MPKIWIDIPGTPPSVNHYVKHTRRGRHYVTKEALRFKESIAILARGRSVKAKEYVVEIMIWLAPKQRLDLDNAAKVCLDGIKEAGIIHSDAAVTILRMMKERAESAELAKTRIGVDEI